MIGDVAQAGTGVKLVVDKEHHDLSVSVATARRAESRPHADPARQQMRRANAVGMLPIRMDIKSERFAHTRGQFCRQPERQLRRAMPPNEQVTAAGRCDLKHPRSPALGLEPQSRHCTCPRQRANQRHGIDANLRQPAD